MGSQTVKADTVNNVEKSSAVQENKMQDASSANTAVSAEAKTNTPDSIAVKPNSTASTDTKPNETDSAVVKPNATDSTTLTVVKPQETRLAKSMNVKAFTESKVAIGTQFNFDDWTTEIDNTYLNITGYTGDRSKQIVVPNGADFAKAGKNNQNLQVEIDKDTLADLIVDGVAPKLSNTDDQKIVAKGNDWLWAFSHKNLHDISGLANLDTSNITNMAGMFYINQISDLSPLTSWNTDKVTNMYCMFLDNQISDLSPLTSWNTSHVTDMHSMFYDNQISDLRPLAGWSTGNVTDMSCMFGNNPDLIDLSPIANWNLSSVHNYEGFFLQ